MSKRSLEERFLRKMWRLTGESLFGLVYNHPKTSAGIGLGAVAALIVWGWIL